MKRSVVLGCTALTALVLATGMASAAGLKPGEWSLGGIQEVCLQSDGTWYYTSYSGLPGGWENTGDADNEAIIYGGTFFSGAGEDSMVVRKHKLAHWTEFANSGNTLYAFNNDFTMQFLGTTCTAPYRKGGHETLPPMKAQRH
jgi:hypothetical protein